MEAMEGFASRRWNPGFVAMRWRHLFWLLPLLWLLAGVAWFLIEQFKETAASGSLAYYSGRDSSMSDEEMAREGLAFMTSREVMEGAVKRLSGSTTWGLNTDVDNIRSRQRAEVDPSLGLSAIKLTVTGRGEKAAHETWMAIYDAAQEIAARDQFEFERDRIEFLKEEVIRLEGELADLGIAPVVSESPSARPARLLLRDQLPGSEDIGTMLSALDDARKELRRLEAGQWCGTGFFNPVGLISSPHLSTPVLPFGQVGMLGVCVASGFGGGLFMAVFLAYLLELLIPRRVESLSITPVEF
jgi:hypothetical protein